VGRSTLAVDVEPHYTISFPALVVTGLGAGESVKALSLYLGHADPGFTLRVYTHLLPSSEDRTRRAVDRALGYEPDDADGPDPVDGLETA
jgi:hypothetical protein